MSMELKHTPTPWTVMEGKTLLHIETANMNDGKPCGMPVCSIPKKRPADAAFIVRAVNCHEELLKALKNCVLDLEHEYITPDSDGYTLAPDSVYWEKMKLYKQVIAKAEEK